MKILVTGGGGFLGQYIVRRLLADGHHVVAFQRSPHPELVALGVEVRQGSLLSGDDLRSSVKGCDAVIHTAAKAGVWGSRRDYFATNVDGTRVLLEAMEETGISKLVYCSSPSVVFDGGDFEGGDESLPYGRNWLCPYPESKAEAERMALEWGRSGKGKVIALRPHLIWGRGDPHLLPVVIQRSQKGCLRIIGDGSNQVDMTRVENAAMAHALALASLEKPEAVNRAYFISQGQPVRLWEWINSFLEKLGISQLERRIPLRAAYAAGVVAETAWRTLGRRDIPPMTRFVAVEMARSHWFSIDAARRDLGYQPEEFPTEEGMAAYIEAWKEDSTPKRPS